MLGAYDCVSRDIHTCYDAGPRCIRSHSKDHHISSPFEGIEVRKHNEFDIIIKMHLINTTPKASVQ